MLLLKPFAKSNDVFKLTHKHCSNSPVSNFQSNLNKPSLNKVSGSNECKAIRKKISKCTDAKQIIQIIKDNTHNNSIDHTVFGAAIQRCGMLKNWSLALKIFELMNRCNIHKSIIEYTILLDVLCKNDQMKLALDILKQHNIKWDLPVFNSLIIGCKHRCNVKLAEKLWNKLHANALKPDLVTFNSMISVYARSGLMDKAETLYEQISDPDSVTFAAMMSGYAISKNKHKMMTMQHYMQQRGIKPNEIHFSCILKCYLSQNEPFEALDFFEYEIKQKLPRERINKLLIHQLCCAYLQIMETCVHSKRQKYFKIITKTLPNEYGLYPANSLLFDALLLKYDEQWHRVVPHFERAIAQSELHGYWKESEFDEWWIDLHQHSHRTARFILHYVLRYEGEYVQNEIIQKDKNVVVLCGRGKHQEGRFQGERNRNSMKDLVRNELLSWNPPIRCMQYERERACLILDVEDVKAFLLEQVFKKTKKI